MSESMRSIVVAIGALGSPQLWEEVAQRAGEQRAIYLVVPATPLRGGEAAALQSEHARWPGEHPAVSGARWRLRTTLEAWRERGIEVEGEVGAADPVRAVTDALTRVVADEVVVSARPARRSPWLANDLRRRLQRSVALPVVMVDQVAVTDDTSRSR